MTANRAELREEYEDALFIMLMHDAAEHEGKAHLDELSMEDPSDLEDGSWQYVTEGYVLRAGCVQAWERVLLLFLLSYCGR